MDSPVGFSLSGNPQTSEPQPPLHDSSSAHGILFSESSESSDSPTSSPASCNGPPEIFTPEEMNAELSAMSFNNEFSRYMREGRCSDYFNGWYMCMERVVYHGQNAQCCLWLAGILRDCMFENFDYYKPFLSNLRKKTHG